MLREAPVKTATTFAEFLEFEEQSQERHEFVDGNLFVMAGGTTRHSVLTLVLISMLMQAALKRGFLICHDVILLTPLGRGYYPDAYFVSQSVSQSARFQEQPIIIIEVLSPSTEAVDRGEKWQAYQQIASLEQYVLLSQNEAVAVMAANGVTKNSRAMRNWFFQNSSLKLNSQICTRNCQRSSNLEVIFSVPQSQHLGTGDPSSSRNG
jgi:Uma2 family endonuclease